MIENSQAALARWERLVATLAAHGVTATLTVRRSQGRSNYSIDLRTATGGHLHIGDTGWRDHWTGWQVGVTDPITDLGTDLVFRDKTRGGVARAVAKAMTA